jgi:glycosyltransferase involved in cell wall biosynthesis
LANLIQTQNCGIAVPPRDPTALARALIKLSEDRQLCELMGQNARGLAESMFSRIEMSRRVTGLLEDLALGPNASASRL